MNIQFIKNNFKSTFEITSIDKETKTSLISNNSIIVYHFDGISKFVAKRLRNGNKPKSCDALYLLNNGDCILIEFKNRIHDVIEKSEIHEKVYDSIFPLLATFYNDLTIDELSEKLTFILVYNDKKNENLKNKVSSSDNWNNIGSKLRMLSGQTDTVFYDLRDLKGFLFKEVYTVDKGVFENEFLHKIIS